jgi:Vanillate O-demethylase oxygenase C-terminal domain
MESGQTRRLWQYCPHRKLPLSMGRIKGKVAAGAKAAFEEDRAIVRAVHLGMKHKTTPTTGLLLDAAATRFRKGLAELVAQEQAQGEAKVG